MKKINSIIINFALLLSLEILFSFFIFYTMTIKSIIFYIIFDFIIVTTIKIMTSLTSEKINKIINLIIMIIINLIFISQFIHYKFYNVFYSTYSLFHSAQIFAFLEAICNIIIENIGYIIILLLPSILLIILYKKTDCKKNNKHTLIYLFLLIITLLCHITLVENDTKDLYSSTNLYHKNHSPTIAVKKLGLINAMLIDVYRYQFGFDDEVLPTDTQKTNSKNSNIINLNYKKTKNENINKINQYIKNKEPSNKNEYTGMFKNKNLIFITAESFSPIAIDQKITPTLYKLSKESFSFENFYTPIYYASTTDGEYSLLTSLLPTEGLWSLQESKNNYFPYSYPNAFTNEYKAYAYHNGEHDFYNRYISHKNLGYNFKACGNGLEKEINCNIWPASDLELLENTFKDYKNEEHFIAYYMTISMHLSYNNKTHAIANKNKELVKNLQYNERIKAYYATAIELDTALKNLIDNLEKENLLNDTVIVLTADHFPYGLTKEDIKSVNKELKDDKYDLHKNTLIIWNNEYKEKKIINKYASNIDVLPTLLNLFGISYDSRLLIGNDILSNKEGLVILNDKSWINKNTSYNALTNTYTNKNISQEEIDKINQEVYNKFAISRLILKEDYYRYLFK